MSSSDHVFFCVILLALAGRRGANVAPEIKLRIKGLLSQRAVIAKTDNLHDMSDALRRMGAAAVTMPRTEYERLLSQCDDRLYAPDGQTAGVDTELRKQAIDIADQIIAGAKS